MEGDSRGYRVALVADELVNPPAGGADMLPVLAEEGWGVMQLPAAWYADDVAAPLLEQVAEAADEFARHGYDLVVVGGHPGLAAALEAARVPAPDVLPATSPDELRAALRARPAPAAAGA